MKLEPLQPPLWAQTGHAQTILGYLLPSPTLKSKGRRLEVELPDGDRLVGFVQEGTSDTVVYVFHGLAGSIDSTYMHRTSILAQSLGHTVFLFNHRGCGEGAGLAKRPYHSGRGEDLAAVMAKGRELFPKKRHLAIGFSMSGNALLLLLSGRRGHVKPDAAIAVNAPIHLERCARLLKTGLNKIYDIKFYLQCRRDAVQANAEVGTKMPRLTSLHDFDNLYTAPQSGFRDREDYYSSCSTNSLLAEIETPTVILTTEDDPFVPVDGYSQARLSRHTVLHIEKTGGHMGYLSRHKTPLGTFRWQDYALHEALSFLS